jgi:ubiquinone/menaquinone biosynthesis C-methylase UbiE
MLREAHRVLKPGGRLVFSTSEVLNPTITDYFWDY